MKNLLPKIKKSIKSYTLNEDGKISKQALITFGAFFGTSAITGLLDLKGVAAHGNNHMNNLSLQVVNHQALGKHTHHASY